MSVFPFFPVYRDFSGWIGQNQYQSDSMHDLNLHRRFAASREGSIFEAVEQNDPNRLLKILKNRKKRPLPLFRDNLLRTAYHLAASKPEGKECLEVLLMYGSNSVRFNDIDVTLLGETPLHIACAYGCDENAFVLLRKGWDPETKTLAGLTALHSAVSSGCMKIVRYLIDRKVDVNSRDKKERTPLHLSAKTRHSDITGILLENGADILAVDNQHNIPLHYACQYGTFETACLLLDGNSATINFKNSAGLTPFMAAVGNFDVHGIQYLLNIGAKTDVCDSYGRMTLCFIASLSRIDSFSLLIRSIDADYIERCSVETTVLVLNNRAGHQLYSSFTCFAIEKGFDYLNVLVNSHFSKSTLQMPSLQYRMFDANDVVTVYSPVAFLFFYATRKKVETFDQCLDFLLQHKIITIDEFQRNLQTKWPIYNVQYVNPLSIVMTSHWPEDTREHYFNKLLANNVTTDYCLRCYHDNKKPFATFYEYKVHYCLVIYAVEKYNTEAMKLLVSNSVILEPDILCNYLIMAYAKNYNSSVKETEEARNLYRYLINLKPVYYKWYRPFDSYDLQSSPFLPAAEHVSDRALAEFCGSPYVFQRSPIYAVPDSPPRLNQADLGDLQVFPYVKPTEEFANVTLQQLCRTAIRHQLRERTLEDNLCNFQSKILELPLPSKLKNYLLFKN